MPKVRLEETRYYCSPYTREQKEHLIWEAQSYFVIQIVCLNV